MAFVHKLDKERKGSVKIHSFTTSDVFDKLSVEWNVLLKRSITDTPFSTFEWHQNWWGAYHPGDLWVLSFRDGNNEVQGIASFFIESDEQGKRIVHFVGCEDVTDYLDILVDKMHHEAVYESLADALIEHRNLYDVLDLCNIPAESPTCTQFAEILQAKGFDVSVTLQEVCPVVPLPETFDDYLQMLDKKQRKEIQRKLRKANGLSDSIHWYMVNGSHDLETEIDKFLQLMAASHPEKAQFLEDQQHVQFFKTLVPAAHQAGWLQMNFLEVAGEPVAAYVNFDYNNKILVYNSGLEPTKAANLSPGIVLLSYNIEHAIEHKREEFDFLRGDEQYKYRMGGQNTEVYNLKATYVG